MAQAATRRSGPSKRAVINSSMVLLVSFLSGVPPAVASVIDTTQLTEVATVQTRGQYDNAQLGTWNGQPLSPTNHPSFEEDQLSATWTFFVDPAATNVLYVVASNVLDTDFGFLFGPGFDLVALTGFEFSLTIPHASSYATFSNNFAVP